MYLKHDRVQNIGNNISFIIILINSQEISVSNINKNQNKISKTYKIFKVTKTCRRE